MQPNTNISEDIFCSSCSPIDLPGFRLTSSRNCNRWKIWDENS